MQGTLERSAATVSTALGPRSRHPLGVLPAFQRDPIGTFMRYQRDYGDVVSFRIGAWPGLAD